MSQSRTKTESSPTILAMPKAGKMPALPASVSASPRPVKYPFAAVVGRHVEKHALLLLAVEPQLRGVLMATAGDWSGSALAGSFGSLLPRGGNRERLPARLSLDDEPDTVPLPIGITDDRLLGGLELEQTLATGERRVAPGLLARAHGRVLYIADVNLLDATTATHVAHALDTRQVRFEREGMSATHDAHFVLLGTFNPAEGEPSALLRDRVALIVSSGDCASSDERVEMIERMFRFDHQPSGFAGDFENETGEINSVIETARTRLPEIRVSRDHLRQLALAAMRLGVEGNRADVFAVKAARANAALAGRDETNEDDLVIAIQLVLIPRATTLPSREEEKQKADEPSKSEPPDGSLTAPQTPPKNREREPLSSSIEDLIIQAIDSRLPDDALATSERTTSSARTGKRFKASKTSRGRYVRSSQTQSKESRIAIDATLRAAAPFQPRRRALNKPVAGESRSRNEPRIEPARRVKIEPGDLRFKEFKHRSGILFIFAVDSSGSMAFNRMAQAKGALTRLLQQAYLHRDKVALLSFRGAGAEVLLTPTRSVELAKRSLDALPAGGGTPLSAAIVKAVELARLARLKGMSQAMLVMFTDGRANVAFREQRATPATSTIEVELRQLGSLLGSEGIASVVVDTKSKFLSSGEASALARMLEARYVYLPRFDAATVYKAIASAAETQRP